MLNFSSRALLALFICVCVASAYGQTKVVVIPMFGDDAASKWRGAWVDETAYKKSDIIEFDGSSYIAVSDHQSSLSNIPPGDGLWNVVAASGANGAAGADSTVAGPMGDTGNSGADSTVAGPKGDTGNAGADSTVAGPKGDTGNAGADSTVAGPKGDTGNAGADSTVAGPKGATGEQGTAADAVAAICAALGTTASCDLVAMLAPVFPKLVFVTSTTHNGNLGGLAGADLICNNLASEGQLEGEFRAWLSSGAGSPNSRFTRSVYPYRLVDDPGVPPYIAPNYTSLTSGVLSHPINRDEYGALVDPSSVWTNTNAGGDPLSNLDCTGWMTDSAQFRGYSGLSDQAGSKWTAYPIHDCSSTRRLYCFEQ
jgi:hypothetical protein